MKDSSTNQICHIRNIQLLGTKTALNSHQYFSKGGKNNESSMLSIIGKCHGSYIPTLAEMAEVYYLMQPYANTRLAEWVEPLSGEYLTSSESSDSHFYGIEMKKGVVISNYSKQYAQLKLRLFYLF